MPNFHGPNTVSIFKIQMSCLDHFFLSKIKPVLYPQLRNSTNHLTLVNVSSLKMPFFVLSHSHESCLLRPKGVFKVGTKISQCLNLIWKYCFHWMKFWKMTNLFMNIGALHVFTKFFINIFCEIFFLVLKEFLDDFFLKKSAIY